MKYVLDASVALKMVLNEQDSPLALPLRDDFRNGIHELIAPDILPAEMGHALTRAERKRVIPQGHARILFYDFLDPCPQLLPYEEFYDRAMQLSSDFRIGFYDCLYVSLAQREGCPLISADEKLVKMFAGQAVSLASL